MLIEFAENRVIELHEWIYQQSRYLKNGFHSQRKYKIEQIVSQENLQMIDIWNIMQMEGIHVKSLFLSLSTFLELWKLFDMKKPIGNFIQPKRYGIKKSHPKLIPFLFGLHTFGLTNLLYEKQMLIESIQKDDIEWIRWGVRYLDIHDMDFWDNECFQIALDYQSSKTIEFIMEYDFDIFEEFMIETHQIEINEEMKPEEILNRLLQKELQSLQLNS
jgi:hypothetical protein